VIRIASHLHTYGGNSSSPRVDAAVGEVMDAYRGERSGRERRALGGSRVLLIGPMGARKPEVGRHMEN
jgi:hypothetical protein